MDGARLRILLIEDNPGDADLVREYLLDSQRGPVDVEHAARLAAGLEQLGGGRFDAVLLDLGLPDSQGLETFRRVHAQMPEVAVVVLSGFGDQTLALEALQEGAQDYLVKGEIDSKILERSLRYAVERKRIELQLHSAKAAAETANRAKSAFLANMSHEIRTPLNAILGMTELALGAEISTEVREYLSVVSQSGEALLMLINDILDFSRIEAGKATLERAPFDLYESIGDTMKSLGVQAHSRGLELACQLHSEVPRAVCGDRGRLRQIITNLVGNAVKFTERGEVVLDVHSESLAENRVRLHVAVRDTGIGVPPDKQAAIFEAFEQADSSAHRRFGGTGLGLAISNRLVQLMGGRLWVDSQVGRGSTFSFTCELERVRPEDAPSTPRRAATVRGTRVLVVDDNATNRQILQQVMRNWGMDATLASGAREALEQLQEAHARGDPFQLLVTDLQMPEIDGVTLVDNVRREQGGPDLPVIVLTSGDNPGDTARCRELGISVRLLKPVKQSELFDAVASALGITEPEDESAHAADATPAPSLRPLRILLAEDSLVNQRLAVALLKKEGHRVTVANNGVEAVDAVRNQHFDLVLMDVQMPDMDGFEATKAIRTEQVRMGRHIPIIAMTAHALHGDRERCLEAGMDGYVAKPIHAKILLQTMQSVLDEAAVG
jgi:two-component system, sensor histidine kinase and response regulator